MNEGVPSPDPPLTVTEIGQQSSPEPAQFSITSVSPEVDQILSGQQTAASNPAAQEKSNGNDAKVNKSSFIAEQIKQATILANNAQILVKKATEKHDCLANERENKGSK